jgi:hypothetical protein
MQKRRALKRQRALENRAWQGGQPFEFGTFKVVPAIVCRRRRGWARVALTRCGAGNIDPDAGHGLDRIGSTVEGK